MSPTSPVASGPCSHSVSGVAELYLSLLAHALTRYGFDDQVPVVPRSRWKRRAWKAVDAALRRRGISAVRMGVAPDAREHGVDWPAHAETMVGLRRLEHLRHCVEVVLSDSVPGDLLEAGVWRGGASIFMRGVLAAYGERDRTVWVADSFQGLPKPRTDHPDDAGDEHWTYPVLAVPEATVRENFSRYGLLDDQVRLLPGWFEETLASAPIDRLALLRADADMYGSTMDILEALYPKVSPGGFVVVDDYGAVAGCRAAVDEYRRAYHVTEPIEAIDWTGVFWRRGR